MVYFKCSSQGCLSIFIAQLQFFTFPHMLACVNGKEELLKYSGYQRFAHLGPHAGFADLWPAGLSKRRSYLWYPGREILHFKVCIQYLNNNNILRTFEGQILKIINNDHPASTPQFNVLTTNVYCSLIKTAYTAAAK